MNGDENNWVGVLLLALFAGFVYGSWPVCLWLAAACLLAWGLHSWQAARKESLLKTILKDARDTAICVAAGFGAVALAQVAMSIAGWVASEGTVRSAENGLAAAASWLSFGLSWRVQLVVWTVLLGLSIWTGVSGVKLYNDRRKLIARIALALNIAASFTFLSASAIQGNEPEWVARRVSRSDFAQRLQQIQETQQALAAHAWVDHELRSLPEPRQREFALLFRDTASRLADESTLSWRAERLAERISPLPPAAVEEANRKAPESPFDTLLSELRAWTEDPSAGRSPTLDNLDTIEREQLRMQQNLQQAEIALSESLKSIISPFIPISDKAASAFAKTFTGSLVKMAFKARFPKSVADLATARAWIQTALAKWETGAAANERPGNWSFAGLPMEKPVEAVVPRTAEFVPSFDPMRPNPMRPEESKANERTPYERRTTEPGSYEYRPSAPRPVEVPAYHPPPRSPARR